MKHKLLTVVIPTYNMEKYLGKCLNSLLIHNTELQSLLEVLIINDGSTDHSPEIGHKYEKHYPHMFKVVDKSNGNYGSCVNRGVLEASGKYIKILDADDQFDTEALEWLLQGLININSDLIITNYVTVDENGNVTGEIKYDIPINEILPSSDLSKIGKDIAMHAVTYRTDMLRKMQYRQTEGISYTDQEWIFKPMSAVRSFVYYDKSLYRYLIGRQGQTMDLTALAKNMHQNLIVLENNINYYNKLTDIPPTYEYLWIRLISLIEYVYKLYLYNTSIMNLIPLIEFDKKIKSLNPNLYNYAATLKAGKLPLVKVWRWFYYKHDYGLNRFFAYRKYRMGIGMK